MIPITVYTVNTWIKAVKAKQLNDKCSRISFAAHTVDDRALIVSVSGTEGQ